jgi:hypothetical protein
MGHRPSVLLAFVAAAVILNGCTTGGSPSTYNDRPSALATSAAPPTTTPASRPPDACRAEQLRVRAVIGGSVASQPFETIALRNAGGRACSLDGYPTITAYGHHSGGVEHRLRIRLRDGAIYERTDPGPHVITLARGQRASFSLGTEGAYQGGAHPILITRVAVAPPRCSATTTLSLRMLATRPVGRAIPVGVTALRHGLGS